MKNQREQWQKIQSYQRPVAIPKTQEEEAMQEPLKGRSDSLSLRLTLAQKLEGRMSKTENNGVEYSFVS